MIVEQIDIEGIAILKTEDQPPIAANCNAPKALEIALQRVQPPAWVSSIFCCIERRQKSSKLVNLVGGQATPFIIMKEPRKRFVTN